MKIKVSLTREEVEEAIRSSLRNKFEVKPGTKVSIFESGEAEVECEPKKDVSTFMDR